MHSWASCLGVASAERDDWPLRAWPSLSGTVGALSLSDQLHRSLWPRIPGRCLTLLLMLIPGDSRSRRAPTTLPRPAAQLPARSRTSVGKCGRHSSRPDHNKRPRSRAGENLGQHDTI